MYSSFGKMYAFFVLVAAGVRTSLSITNDPGARRDSYMSAYLDLHHGASTEPAAGVVYAEPVRAAYGPPQSQPKPFVYYGPPTPNSHYGGGVTGGGGGGGGPFSAIPVDHHAYAQDYSYAPVVDILTRLPDKLEFLPKLVAGFLGITKILLKVVLLKMILKFIVMFCLFFFLPKLEMLDMSADGEPASAGSASPAASSNNTGPHTPVEDLEEGRLNSITHFVLDSVESRRFLKMYCRDSQESTLKCRMMKMLVELEGYATTSRLLKLLGRTTSTTEIPQ